MVVRGCVCVSVYIYVCDVGVLSWPHSVNNPINWLTKQPRGNDNINPGFRGHYVSARDICRALEKWGEAVAAEWLEGATVSPAVFFF